MERQTREILQAAVKIDIGSSPVQAAGTVKSSFLRGLLRS
jgi:hypothetical protein